ncbi:KEOPS complex subunit Cgi121 [Archaeoglobus veneficus]|uniref:KEOPS complex subunit Cgi121 n=1 Tax=Archaeoglobus veneficus (strain DSM 11195 / SNP6) TaxID=693661 RepID=F2KS54_ARCVS|nr:KEOPS complex subunit Cgi121 [Archaeoglobus veneficus]AEA47993.1 protein of unknown function DUF509 [Archaeoglobus veneficus SNP6]
MISILQGILDVEDVEEFLLPFRDCAVFLNADYIADETHAELAARKALRAWHDGRNVAKTLPVEVILYAAATRQINRAMELGLKTGTNRVVVVVLGDCIDKVSSVLKEENVLKMDEEKIVRLKQFFRITDEELEVAGVEKLPLLVRERVVLFDLTK